MDVAAVLNDMDAAERAFSRVEPEMNALKDEEFTFMNVDVVAATSAVLGVVDRIVPYRDRLAQLPGFDVAHVDNIIDYATAAWYVVVTNVSVSPNQKFDALMQECAALREKLLMWAQPLAANGDFEQESIDKIKAGSGNKDVPSDVVALVGLFRSAWDRVENNCAVTEADLDRGAQIGPYVFAMVSQREHRPARSSTPDARRVRAAWTLVDRAYDQCRRGLTYLLWDEGGVERIAPSLRRNIGPRRTATPTPEVTPSAEARTEATLPTPPGDGSIPIGGGDAPFVTPTN